MDVKGQKVSVIGAAKSGIAAAKVLAQKGAVVLLSDTLPYEKLKNALEKAHLSSDISVETGGHTDKVLNADFIVLSPGVPPEIPILKRAVAAKIPIHSEIEIAYRLSKGKRLVVTGSNGKTTTTSLLAEFCRKDFPRVHLGGNIGFPMIEFAGETTDSDIQVIEVSSFQLETISSFRPDIGIITNFYENHLDRYPSFEAYCEAKQRISMNMKDRDILILNSDQMSENSSFLKNLKCRKAWFGWDLRDRIPGTTIKNGTFVFIDEKRNETALFSPEIARIFGRHNHENIMAAVTAAILCGVNPRNLESVVAQFPGVEHRLEWVRELGGVTFINDSKGTNCAASQIALKACKGSIILIAGGRDKGTELFEWVSTVREKAKGVVLLGEAKERFRAALEGIVPLKMGKDFEDSVRLAVDWAQPGDTVLLSPACSSYDMFPNFEVRGKTFKDLIYSLPGKK